MHPAVRPVAGQVQPTPLHDPSTAASGAVWVAAAGSILMAASSLTFGCYQASTQAQLGMVLMGGGLLLSLIGQAVAGILVIVWVTRARANADALYVARHRPAAGWAIGGWFIPIGNLFLPVVVVLDLVKASSPTGQSLPQVWMWWAGWIGGSLATPIVIAVTLASDPLTPAGAGRRSSTPTTGRAAVAPAREAPRRAASGTRVTSALPSTTPAVVARPAKRSNHLPSPAAR